MKYLSTVLACLVANSNVAFADLGVHIVGSNSVQGADRVRGLLRDNKQVEAESFLENIETQSLGGVGAKAQDGLYNASGGVAYIDKYLGGSSVVGVSLKGIYAETNSDSLQSQDISLSTNLYAATKASNTPLELFADIGYTNFLGDGVVFSNGAMSALGGLALNVESSIEGLSYTPLLMLNSLRLQDSSNADSSTYNALKMIAGVELDYAISKNYTASLKGLYAYEFKDTSQAYNYNDFTGNYTYLGEAGNSSLQLGASLNYNFTDTISAGFDYSIYFYDTFTSKNISLKVDFSF